MDGWFCGGINIGFFLVLCLYKLSYNNILIENRLKFIQQEIIGWCIVDERYWNLSPTRMYLDKYVYFVYGGSLYTLVEGCSFSSFASWKEMGVTKIF